MTSLRPRIARYAYSLVAVITLAAAALLFAVTLVERSEREARQRIENVHLNAMTLSTQFHRELTQAQLALASTGIAGVGVHLDALSQTLDRLADGHSARPDVEHASALGEARELLTVTQRSRTDNTPPERMAAYFETLRNNFEVLSTLHSSGAQAELASISRGREVQRRNLWLAILAITSISGLIVWRILRLIDASLRRQARIEKELLGSRERIHQMQKLEALGQLVGGVAHDFNNLMTAILGHAQLMMLKQDQDQDSRNGLLQIEAAAERAADLTQQLLAFSRRKSGTPRAVDLCERLHLARDRLRAIVGEHREFKMALDPDPVTVSVDPAQMESVVTELLSNACDATTEDGTVSLSLATVNVALDHPSAEVLGEGKFCRLRITDSGSGMDPTTQERIFEPFFTTKEQGAGKGLGLSMALGVVQSCGGCIVLDSAPGNGTRVDVYLPTVASPSTASDAASLRTEAVKGSETILVVDDEASIRELIAAGLTQLGYRVLNAADGKEAIEICSEHVDDLDLLLSDVVMPGLNGVDIARQATKICPEIGVVLMSGFADDVLREKGVVAASHPLIDKPFQINELAGLVRKTLDEREDAA